MCRKQQGVYHHYVFSQNAHLRCMLSIYIDWHIMCISSASCAAHKHPTHSHIPAISGTGDESFWLGEACKILLLPQSCLVGAWATINKHVSGSKHATVPVLRYKSEVAQQKILFRGSFGTQKPGGARSNAFDIFMKNAANTNVIHWGGRLLALFESAQPIAMDPYSLKTLGPDLLGGSVKAGASFDFGPGANGLAGMCLPVPSLHGKVPSVLFLTLHAV